MKNERLTFGPSIGQVIETPLVLHGGRLYFGRYFDDLCRLASAIARRAVTTPEKDWLPLTQTTDSLSPGQKRGAGARWEPCHCFGHRRTRYREDPPHSKPGKFDG